MLVVLTDVSGNVSMSWGLKHQGPLFGVSPLVYLSLIFNPWVVLGTTLLLVWLLSRIILLGWADLSYVLPLGGLRSGIAGNLIAVRLNRFIQRRKGDLVA